jgi:hypothetical protein
MLLVSVPNGLAFFLKSPQAGLHLKHEISKQLSCMGTHSDDGRTQAGRVRFENYFWLMVHAQCELLSHEFQGGRYLKYVTHYNDNGARFDISICQY